MTDRASASEPPDDRLLGDRYRLGPRIGRGGMASIHRATDLRTGRSVAVKLLHPEVSRDPDLAQRFRREALAATVLRHPNIVACLDTGTDGSQAYLVMDLIDGEDLAARLRRGGRLAPWMAARIGLDVARALGVAHVRGIVHRDIKPGNILLAEDGRAMVTDFGIARLAADAEAALPGTTLGSVHYFSPEQARGASTTPASDVYGLGLVLYEALTGARAWTGATTDEIALARIDAPAPSPRAVRPEVPEELDAVVRRALAPRKDDRFRNGQEMAAALEPIVATGERREAARAAATAAVVHADDTGRVERAADRSAGVSRAPAAGTRTRDHGSSRAATRPPRRDAPSRRRADRRAGVPRPPAAVVLVGLATLGVLGGGLLVAFVPGRAGGEEPATSHPGGLAEASATPGPTPAPTPIPTPTPALKPERTPTPPPTDPGPTAVPPGDVADLCEIFFDIPCGLGPGRYAPSRFETPFDLELGEGWSAATHERDIVTLLRDEGAVVFAGTIRETYPDGRTVEPKARARDLIEDFVTTEDVAATDPVDVRIDGRRGRSTDLRPLDDEPVDLFATDGSTYRLEPGRMTRVVALDVRDATVVLVIEPTGDATLRQLLDVADPVAGTIRWR